MFEGMNIIDFDKSFACDDDCREYLFVLKWKSGYKCSRCGCAKSWKGRTSFHKRCSNCWYDESPTANTVFHKIKIPLLKAFVMSFRIAVPKKASSCLGLSREYSVSKDSAWLFKRKCQEAVRTTVSTEPPRYHPRKERILNERNENKVGAKDSDKIKPGQATRVPAKSNFVFKGIGLPLDHQGMQKAISFSLSFDVDKGSILAHNFKTWIKGVHHHCSERFVTGYLEEYFFRHYYRKRMNEIWHRLIECFVNNKPYYYKAIEV